MKKNTDLLLLKVLHKILQVRYKNVPVGHLVSMSTKISGEPIFIIAYAWSQRGVSYMISTCGSTAPHQDKYLSYFEDDFGNVTWIKINLPCISNFCYKYFPLIDEYNEQRQSLLNLGKN